MRPARGSALVAALAVFVGGILMAAQSRANGTLATVLGDPVVTGIWSIGSGWLLMLPAFLAPGPRRVMGALHAAYRSGVLSWWMFLGGLAGGLLVTMQGYAVPLAGVALVLVCLVAGQTSSALAVDQSGIAPGGAKPISRARVAAAALTLVGVLVAVGPKVGAGGVHFVLPALAALAVGTLLAVQTATNGRVNVVGGNPLVTTWINFTWGLVVVVVAWLVRAAAGNAALPRSYDAPWWAWTGGLLGLTYVGINAVAVRRVGVLLVMLLGVAGQLGGALVLDLANPVTRGTVTASTVLGVLVTMAAAMGSALAARRS
ncbi:MAG: DMT family transporter [Austwickia sp.]|jgi:bacterial/archaeal transporter family-2 protein|nr:MAG: DMT family transporter [Austwickia sp.]